jgi:hypothetical protein
MVVPCVSATGPQKIVDSKIRYFMTEALSAGKVKAELMSFPVYVKNLGTGGGTVGRHRSAQHYA